MTEFHNEGQETEPSTKEVGTEYFDPKKVSRTADQALAIAGSEEVSDEVGENLRSEALKTLTVNFDNPEKKEEAIRAYMNLTKKNKIANLFEQIKKIRLSSDNNINRDPTNKNLKKLKEEY